MDSRTASTNFRKLHQGPRPLLLPNAWEAGSARLIQSCGAQAIATTSAGLAWSHGYADGGAFPAGVLFEAVREIARVISVPLTVDMEKGYSSDLAAIAENAHRLAEAGARPGGHRRGVPARLPAKGLHSGRRRSG